MRQDVPTKQWATSSMRNKAWFRRRRLFARRSSPPLAVKDRASTGRNAKAMRRCAERRHSHGHVYRSGLHRTPQASDFPDFQRSSDGRRTDNLKRIGGKPDAPQEIRFTNMEYQDRRVVPFGQRSGPHAKGHDDRARATKKGPMADLTAGNRTSSRAGGGGGGGGGKKKKTPGGFLDVAPL